MIHLTPRYFDLAAQMLFTTIFLLLAATAGKLYFSQLAA